MMLATHLVTISEKFRKCLIIDAGRLILFLEDIERTVNYTTSTIQLGIIFVTD